jgi:hypothetical protein
MSQSFEYEFVFSKTYDHNVFTNSPVTQTPEFEELLKNTVDSMIQILNMYGGVKTFSSFITHDNLSYKVTVNNE